MEHERLTLEAAVRESEFQDGNSKFRRFFSKSSKLNLTSQPSKKGNLHPPLLSAVLPPADWIVSPPLEN